MAEVDSDLIKAWRNRQRVRCSNNRGSVLSSVAEIDGDLFKKNEINNLFLFVLPYSACIRNILIQCTGENRNKSTHAKVNDITDGLAYLGKYTLHAHAINADNTLTDLGAFSEEGNPGSANLYHGTFNQLLNHTIYQELIRINGEDALAEYSNQHVCVISMNQQAASYTDTTSYEKYIANIKIMFDYVDAGQSMQRFSGAAIEDGYWEDE